MNPEFNSLLTIDDLCRIANVSKNTVRSWVREDRVPYLKAGQLVRFDNLEIQAWLRRHHPGASLPPIQASSAPIIVIQLAGYERIELDIPEFNAELLVEGRGVFVPLIAGIPVAECAAISLSGREVGAFLHSPTCPVSLSIPHCIESPDDASVSRCPSVDLGEGYPTRELPW